MRSFAIAIALPFLLTGTAYAQSLVTGEVTVTNLGNGHSSRYECTAKVEPIDGKPYYFAQDCPEPVSSLSSAGIPLANATSGDAPINLPQQATTGRMEGDSVVLY